MEFECICMCICVTKLLFFKIKVIKNPEKNCCNVVRYFGHVMRTDGTLEWDIMIGQVDGCRRQGRPRLRWMDSIKENTGFGLEKLKEIVKDRNKWRRLVEEKTRNRE